MKKADLIFAAVIFALCVYVGYVALGYPSDVAGNGYGAGVYPLILVGLIILSCLALILTTVFSKINADQHVDFSWESIRRPFLMTAFILIFALSLRTLGFLPSAMLLVFAASRIMKSSWKTTVVTSVAASVIVYYLFAGLLRMPLPSGMLWR